MKELIDIIVYKEIYKTLITAIAKKLQNNLMTIDDHENQTLTGVPKGSILSTILFNLSVNKILD
jgi:hypothetical protein